MDEKDIAEMTDAEEAENYTYLITMFPHLLPPDPAEEWVKEQMEKDRKRRNFGCRHRSEGEVIRQWGDVASRPDCSIPEPCCCCHGPQLRVQERKTCILCVRRQGWMDKQGVKDWSDMRELPRLAKGEEGQSE